MKWLVMDWMTRIQIPEEAVMCVSIATLRQYEAQLALYPRDGRVPAHQI